MEDKFANIKVVNFFKSNKRQAQLILPFLDAGFNVTWAKNIYTYGSEFSFIIIKAIDNKQGIFSFEYEVLLVYSKYKKLEPRTFQAINRFMTTRPARGRVESLTYFIISEDNNAESWVQSYLLEQKEEKIAIPISAEKLINKDKWAIINAVKKHYLMFDRFKFTLPLQTDTYFFGRNSELKDMLESCNKCENIGLFGLRKTGKTSLLLKIKRSMEISSDHLVAYIDAQDTRYRLKRWNQLLMQLCKMFSEQTKQYSFVEEEASESFYKIFENIIDSTSKKITLIFDEIEWISPETCKDKHWDEEFVNFWQTIRVFQTNKRKLNIVIAGVNPSMVERDNFFGFQNPLFGIVNPIFLTCFSESEVRDMVLKIGKIMGIKFSNDALSFLYEQYGGHPLLTRLACSFSTNIAKYKGKNYPINISKSDMLQESSLRDRELTFYPKHIVSELEKFYPDEYSLLEELAIGRYNEFIQQIKDPRKGRHLIKYGIIENINSPYVTIKVVQDYVARENAIREGRNTPFSVVDIKERENFLKLRIETIIDDLRYLERQIKSVNKPLLFGPNSFPEADKLLRIVAPKDINTFISSITILHRIFVESIEVYGRSINKDKYFWIDIKENYKYLHKALHRIKIYRIDCQHLEIMTSVTKQLEAFLQEDIGDDRNNTDKYWILFQRSLDELFRAIQTETANISK